MISSELSLSRALCLLQPSSRALPRLPTDHRGYEMNEQCYKNYKLYVYAAGIFALIYAVFTCVFNNTYYDYSLGLYAWGTPAILPFIFGLGAVLFFITALFTLDKASLPFAYPKRITFFTCFCVIMAAFSLLLAVLLRVTAEPGDPMLDVLGSADTSLITAGKMLKTNVILALPAALYFIWVYVTGKPSGILGIALNGWLFTYLLYEYYDMTRFVMDPVKMLTVVSFCSVALFTMADVRYATDHSTPRFFVVAGGIATVFPLASGCHKLIAALAGNYVFGLHFAYDLAEICLALYVFSRLLTFTNKTHFSCLTLFEGGESRKESGVQLSGVQESDVQETVAADAPEEEVGEENPTGESESVEEAPESSASVE